MKNTDFGSVNPRLNCSTFTVGSWANHSLWTLIVSSVSFRFVNLCYWNGHRGGWHHTGGCGLWDHPGIKACSPTYQLLDCRQLVIHSVFHATRVLHRNTYSASRELLWQLNELTNNCRWQISDYAKCLQLLLSFSDNWDELILKQSPAHRNHSRVVAVIVLL